MRIAVLLSCIAATGLTWSQQSPPRTGKAFTKTLFDGKSLDGWRGDPDRWSVQDGAIVGKFSGNVPTTFLYTNDSYSDFRLTLLSRMVARNAVSCIWAEIADRGESSLYTPGPLGVFPKPGIWDYIDAKGIRVYKPAPDSVAGQLKWLKVEILAQGNRVRSAFNGVQAMDWLEAGSSSIKEGPIGLRLPVWNACQEVHYKDVVVETFPKEDRLITVKSR